MKQPLPISDVVKMSESGMSPEEVVQRIRASRTTYALRGSHFAKLQAAGVSDEVLDYLQQSFVDDVDLLTRYWVAGETLGGCSSCYPQPVNLDATISGFGAADTPGRYRPGLPPGVPEWVATDRGGLRSKPISVSDILGMSKRGEPDSKIVDSLRNSRLERLTTASGVKAIRTHPLAGLSGAEFARLKTAGVSDAVLDELQRCYLAQFVEVQRLRYQNWGRKK